MEYKLEIADKIAKLASEIQIWLTRCNLSAIIKSVIKRQYKSPFIYSKTELIEGLYRNENYWVQIMKGFQL